MVYSSNSGLYVIKIWRADAEFIGCIAWIYKTGWAWRRCQRYYHSCRILDDRRWSGVGRILCSCTNFLQRWSGECRHKIIFVSIGGCEVRWKAYRKPVKSVFDDSAIDEEPVARGCVELIDQDSVLCAEVPRAHVNVDTASVKSVVTGAVAELAS